MNIIKRIFIRPFYFMGMLWIYSLPTAIVALGMAYIDSNAVLLAIENTMPWEHPFSIYREFAVMRFSMMLIYGLLMLYLGIKGFTLDMEGRGPASAWAVTERKKW